MSETDTPLILYMDRTGELDLDNLPEKTEKRGLEGFGTQPFGTSSFGLGLRSEPTHVARRFDTDLREGLDFRKGINDVGDFSVDIPGGFDLHDWTEARYAILDDDAEHLAFTGKITKFSHSTSRHVATLEGSGPGYPLRRGSATVEYQAIPAYDAFADYCDRFLPEWDVSVQDPTIETLFRERKLAAVEGVRDDLEQATDITETDPIAIRDGAITPLQTCFTTEAEHDDSRSISGDDSDDAGSVTNTNYSNNHGVRLTTTGEYIEFLFEPEYQIPQLRVGIRGRANDPAPEVELLIGDRDRQSLGTVVEQGEGLVLQWIDMREFGDAARNIDGRTRLRLEVTQDAGTNGAFYVDVVAPYDMRYSYTWDNEGVLNNNDVRHLDGPELYPAEVLFEAARAEATANIYAARINAELDDTSGRQAVELSNDGRFWEGETNVDSVSVDFEGVSFGYGVTPRFALGRTDDVRDTATPRRGFAAHRLAGWTVWGSGNDLQVIEDKELTDNHLPNLQWIAERGNIVFHIPVTRPDEPRELIAFHPGQNTERLPVTASDWGDLQSEKSTGPGYANYVIVEGRRDPATGERPRGEAFDEEEIQRRGGWDDRDAVVDHVDTDATITNATDAEAKADQLLEDMVGEDEFSGAVETLPLEITADGVRIKDAPDLPINPGIAYFLREWGTFSTLEEISVEESDSGTHLTLDFDRSDDILDEIMTARRKADDAHKAQ